MPEIVITRRTTHSSTPGVENIEYKIPNVDAKMQTTGTLKGMTAKKDYTKTIYNSKIWTDAKLEQALRESYTNAVKTKGITNLEANEIRFLGKTSDGYQIEGIVRDGEFATFYFK